MFTNGTAVPQEVTCFKCRSLDEVTIQIRLSRLDRRDQDILIISYNRFLEIEDGE